VRHAPNSKLLNVSFPGQAEPVDWKITFVRNSVN